ncbi:GMC family oxidoreductase [Rhodoblastus sp.]|uniref:GMC family oxidoreductase n=1 Tax=Rhodoblastus sp. TaxID=1962975 RepID=UPI0035AEA4D8
MSQSSLSADVVIVGAGVAGSLLAFKLAGAGIKVLILEAGPRIDRGDAVGRFQASARKGPNSAYVSSSIAPHPDTDDMSTYYINDGPDPFTGVYLRGVGGTTWHMGGTASRFRPSDFRTRSLFGVGLDWPLGYNDLVPFYEEAERETGVAGDPSFDEGAPRRTPFPMSPVPATYLDRKVAEVLPPLGLTLGVFPQFRNTRDYDDRPACCGNASCVPVCPIGAKWDASVHAAKAEALGARVEADAVATAVDVGADGQVSRIRFLRPDRSEGEARGRIFVIAAHAIETPKLLLMSRSELTPNGVANSSDMVGRNLMGQIDQVTLGLAGDPVYPYRGPVGTSGIAEFRDGPFRATQAAVGTSVSNAGWQRAIGPLEYAEQLARLGFWGKRLRQAVADRTARELMIGSTSEMLPDSANRIVPDFGQRDTAGLPRPRITFKIDDYAKRGLNDAVERQNQIFGALRATEMRTLPMAASTAIILGTARMGTDAKTSVVDPELRAHDYKNLFIVGGATFPTSGVLPPTLTIAALALRAAETIQRLL